MDFGRKMQYNKENLQKDVISVWKEFKEFAFKGNVVDMAVGVMVGGAFSKIVTSVVNDVFMPLLSTITGKLDFSTLYLPLDGNTYESYQAAVDAAAPMLKYGAFLQTVLDFFLIALCIFMFVRLITKMRKKNEQPAPAPAPVRKCPYCFGEIDDNATRCRHCTSQL